jgi:hypothetical protein
VLQVPTTLYSLYLKMIALPPGVLCPKLFVRQTSWNKKTLGGGGRTIMLGRMEYKTYPKIKDTYIHLWRHIDLSNASKLIPLCASNRPQTWLLFTCLSAYPQCPAGVTHNCNACGWIIYNMCTLKWLSVSAFLRYASSTKVNFARHASKIRGNTLMDSRWALN